MSDPLDPLLDASSERIEHGDSDAQHLPGADRPHWLLPALVIAFGSLIAGLVIFGQPAEDDIETVLVSPAPAGPSALPAGEGSDDGEVPAPTAPGSDVAADQTTDQPSAETARSDAQASDGQTSDDAAVVDPVADAEAAAADEAPALDTIDVELPEIGVIRVGDSEFPLLRSCVGLQPLAPNDTGAVVSAHVFSPDGEREQIVERWFTSDGIDGVRVDGPGAAGLRQVSVGDVDTDGAFVASFEQPDGGIVDLAVNPLPEEQRDCGQVVVTNEPGQFAFPYTRAVLAVCVDGDPSADGRIVAMLTERGRMLAVGNGDGSHTLTLRTAETLLSPQLELVDPDGELFVDDDRFGFSGLVTDGETSFDLTFDVDVTDARTCTADDF